MSYPKQVVLVINHSEDERQIKRLHFKTIEEHIGYLETLPTNQMTIEEVDKDFDAALSWPNKTLTASDLLHATFEEIGKAYKAD